MGMDIISAKEAKGRTLEIIDSHLGDDLNQVMEAIEDAINEGKFQAVVSRIGAFPNQLVDRLRDLGYGVEYGQKRLNSTVWEDKGKLIIDWE